MYVCMYEYVCIICVYECFFNALFFFLKILFDGRFKIRLSEDHQRNKRKEKKRATHMLCKKKCVCLLSTGDVRLLMDFFQRHFFENSLLIDSRFVCRKIIREKAKKNRATYNL
jgi:hypothetical protein